VSFPFDLHSAAMFDSRIRLIHTYHAMVCVNQTQPHCVNQMGKNGTAGEQHGMCESAFMGLRFCLCALVHLPASTHRLSQRFS
jgi:hypothetical protein